MPDVLRIDTGYWVLSVWTKDIQTPHDRLKSTLKVRGRDLPSVPVRFSPPLTVSAVQPVAGIILSEQPVTELIFPSPVFFENRAYDFEFQFSPDSARTSEPKIIHWLKSVEDGFRFSRDCLRGSINFGNDVGWFRLGLIFDNGRREIEQFLSFEVLPTKMDMAGDFDRIHREIDSTYPLWRFSFAQKTEHELATSRKPHERFPLLWLALFRSLRSGLENAVKLICRSPHSRLLPLERFQRPDCLKGRLTPRLEEQVTEQCRNGELHRRHRIETRRLSVDTPENRFVKMVMTRCIRELSVFSRRARLNNAVPDRERLSNAFFAELDGWQKPLEQRLAEPLFREVGSYNGMAQESLVLHHRAGYAKVYRIWQELKLYLDLFGRQASISMKSVAELYEVWCLLEIRRMLMALGFTEVETRKAALRTKGLEKDLADGMGTAFRFTRRDGLEIRLAHEPPFSVTRNPDARGIYSWTTPQKPDILLEAALPDGSRINWIFDAKYRIDAEDGKDDLIPDDAINQMHRYRDALIHLKKADDGVTEKSRPVVGAFVLYPGWFDEETGKNPYTAAVEAVGIGGFPLLPGRDNLWLRAFLKEKFGDLSREESKDRVMEADEHLLHESVRIAPTGLSLSRYSDLTLVASLGAVSKRDKQYVDCFMAGTAGWYHIPVSTTDKRISRTVMRELRCCAVAVHPAGAGERRIEYLYDVVSVKLVNRCELGVEQAGTVDPDNRNEYWLLQLGTSRTLPHPVSTGSIRSFRFRLTAAADLLGAKSWSDLPDRYASVMKKSDNAE
ncbi:restriction endonuclease-like protein [Geotalea uraniireducens]|uniref:DUF2357 domain-containing protein n=1 Tax=Geotalea uraniireducens (strain Rf4) TaxID=351605 RepID=A5G8Z2_GEOUR|nr:restriction endonuclease-like protein [Geotalea uraniireducens]ABQ28260.1 conserved hypothetical protein [Geotalea uraniireducens Rf4]